MALALGVRKGSTVLVGDQKLDVLEVHGLNVKVQATQEFSGDIVVDLDDQERHLLFQDVYVSTSKGKNNDGLTRLVFEAPLYVKIIRD